MEQYKILKDLFLSACIKIAVHLTQNISQNNNIKI